VGAGGGSIASLDVLRQIRVGPHSAGSEPGPACYQRGGDQPTVTDADLLLGRLDAHNFAGGSITLSAEKSAAAVKQDISAPLGLSELEGAFGIAEMVDENMSNAARVHTVESGKEIDKYTMITFGGAGPLHAARLCEKTGIARFLVPPGAGVGSAIGFLRAPFGYESVRSANFRLSSFDAAAATQLVAQLRDESLAFARQGVADGVEPVVEAKVYMRYVGQGWEIPVMLPPRLLGGFDGDASSILRTDFEAAYTRFFGRPIDGLDIEIIRWAVKAASPLPPVARVTEVAAGAAAPITVQRRIFDARLGREVMADIVEREGLNAGSRITGPAIVVERETSTLITSAFEAVVQDDGCLLVSLKTSS